MTVTGLQILERTAQKRPDLCVVGKATGGTTTTCIDTTRLQGDTLPADLFAGCWIMFVSGTNIGVLARIDQFAGSSGTITFSPAAGAAVVSGDEYVITRHVLLPSDFFQARDRALNVRCSRWSIKPLSVLTDVETWTTKINGSETLTAAAMSFPDELAAKSLLVNNNAGGTNGGVKSESYYVQAGVDSLRATGMVSVRTGTANIIIRDVTNGANISLNGTSSFTLRGWQHFDVSCAVPSGCGEVQVWIEGAGTSDVAEWCNVALLPLQATRFSLQSRVLSETEVGEIYGRRGPTNIARWREWVPLDASRSRGGGALTELVFASPPGAFAGGVFYQEQHHYDALQSAYFAASDHSAGLAATTDCELDYIEAATVVELLENRAQDPLLNKVYLAAEKDLGFWERKLGAKPIVVEEQDPPSRRPFLMPLR